MNETIKNGLVLPGGGARAAYQVGVLKAVAKVLPGNAPNPFPVIAGTSAGAVNATVLASRAEQYSMAVRALESVWAGFRVNQVYRSGAGAMLKSSLHWAAALVLGGLGVANPKSLLDNAPLKKLLAQQIQFGRIGDAVSAGHLDALAVTLSGYSSSGSATFFEGRADLAGWRRMRREGQPARITLDHLMATVAIPFVFPPYLIGNEYFGDGVMRQTAPLAPAIHLGADRVLVIGVRDEEPSPPPPGQQAPRPPSLAQIGGYLLDNLLMDWLYADLERVTKINQLLEQVGPGALSGPAERLRRVDTMVILPSQDIREIAAMHQHCLPLPVRMLLGGLGVGSQGGRQLLSYMLFESDYTRELIQLGYEDGMAQRDHLEAFVTGQPVPALDAPSRVKMGLSE